MGLGSLGFRDWGLGFWSLGFREFRVQGRSPIKSSRQVKTECGYFALGEPHACKDRAFQVTTMPSACQNGHPSDAESQTEKSRDPSYLIGSFRKWGDPSIVP